VHKPASGEQCRLDLGGQIEVLLQSPLLKLRQVIQAEADKWVGHKPVILDGLVACLAKTIGSFIHAG
jgi:hypothetical protein